MKIDPKAIGVGQYQHDVFQPLLKRKLEEVIESCVNAVGVELNTASAPLLAHVAGVGPSLAKKIIKHREDKGAFASRAALKDVPGLGQKTYEQCAGFRARARRGASARRLGGAPGALLAGRRHRQGSRRRRRPRCSVTASCSVGCSGRATSRPTSACRRSRTSRRSCSNRDAIRATPSRRPPFRDDVRTMGDLQVGMTLEGVVTNVTAFGAFVDVGVHQDGLVHVSQLADRFVKDPHEGGQGGGEDQGPRPRGRPGPQAHRPHGEERSWRRRPPGSARSGQIRWKFRRTGRLRAKRWQFGERPACHEARSGGRSAAQPAVKGFTNNPFAQAFETLAAEIVMRNRERQMDRWASVLGRVGVGAAAACALLVPVTAHAQAAGGATSPGTVTSTTTTTTTVSTPATTTTPPATEAHEEGSTVPRQREREGGRVGDLPRSRHGPRLRQERDDHAERRQREPVHVPDQ